MSNKTTKKIEYIFKENYDKNPKIIVNKGIGIKLRKPIYVLGEENLKIKKMPITYVWRMKNEKLIKIKTENNLEIKTTPEHKFAVNLGNKIKYVKAGNLKKNHKIHAPEYN